MYVSLDRCRCILYIYMYILIFTLPYMYTGLNTYKQIALDRASDKGVIVIVQELLKFIPNVNPKVKV